MRAIKFLGLLAVCASYSAIAQAQTTPPSEEATDESAIVVTGSRIVRDGSQAPTPVTAVTAEALTQSSPSNIPDALNKLPQFTGSTSQSAGGTFNAGSAPLGNYLNLRGLGAARNLILLNGQRVPPTLNTNAVDTNILPQMLVKRVDVVTGGVSAVYGSDAVSGVVNFILDTKFNGLKVSGQAGISNYGDSFSYRYGAAFGTDIGEKIHLIASYEHYKNKGVDSIYARDWSHDSVVLQGAGTSANPILVFSNVRRCNATNGGLVSAGALYTGPAAASGFCPNGVTFRPDGTLAPYDNGTPVFGLNGTTSLSNQASIGGQGGIFGEPRNGGTSLTGPLSTHQAFGRIEAEVSDNISFYAQGSYAISKTSFNSTTNSNVLGVGARTITIFADNPYLRPELKTILDNAGQSSFVMGRMFNDVPLVRNRTSTEYWSAQAGLTGDLGGWKWDLNYTYGNADQNIAFNEWNTRKFFAAVDAAKNAGGQIVCRVNLTATVLPGCIPMNLMGDGSISREAFLWARDDSKVRYLNTMQYVNFNIHGDLFNLPAGAVRLAVGAEYREQTLKQTSNSDPAFFADPTTGAAARAAYYSGIRGVPAAALLFNSINFGLASGKQTVKEAYGEVAIPLLKDTAGFQDLSLDLAGRITDYKTSGTVTTWKVGANWTPVNGLRIRANRSRDIAAPNLSQLYGGASIVFQGLIDPSNGQQPVVQVISGGNAALKPEFADTTTIGIVAQPAAIPGLTVSLDAYRVVIKGAIGSQGAQTMLNDCFASASAPSCSLITRTGGVITSILAGPLNLAKLETQGIDLEVGYRFPLVGGNVTLRGFVNYLDRYNTQDAPSQPVRVRLGRVTADNDGYGLPRWKGLLSQAWDNERLSLSVSERFTGKYTLGPPQQIWGTPWVMPNKVYVDTNVSYYIDPDKKFEAFLNVQNLFNVQPPIAPILITNLGVPTDKASYDPVGRYFTLGFRAKF